jgi:NitT/TauT family transport system substrate-binding protein
MRSLRKSLVLLLLILGLLAAACGGDDGDSSADASGGGSSSSAPVDVRLGYFPNITHAPGIIGVLGGYFEDALPEGDTLKTTTFNAGPEAVQALLTDSLDLTFIGPNPAINAFAQSKGSAIRIVSGTTSGGAFLVVKDGIDSASDLKGKAIATPQLGNTQDVALRAWLKDEGLSADGPAAATCPSSPRPTATPSPPSSAGRSTVPGCRSPGPAGSSKRARATCSSTRPTSGPRASTSPPT